MAITRWLIFLALVSGIISNAQASGQDIDSENEGHTLMVSTDSAENQTKLKMNGFGSLGALTSSQNQGDYVLDSFMPKGAGYSNSIDFSNYSKLGVQVNALLTPKCAAQIQVVTGYTADGSFQPEVEWYNFKYIINSELSVRVGRIELPTFLDSGNHDVGYSYVWAHLPLEMYHLLSIQTSDGVDTLLTSDIGNARNSLKLFLGQNTSDRPTTITTSRRMWGVFDKLDYNNISFYLGYQKRDSLTQNKATGLSHGWREDTDLSVGLNYDSGSWFLMSEWIQSQTRYNSTAMYFGAGYHINKFTPYFIHSHNNAGSFSAGALPSATSILLANRSQKTESAGLRWDFMKNYDFKLQYDKVTLGENSNGFLVNVPANTLLYGDTFEAISAVVDFVF